MFVGVLTYDVAGDLHYQNPVTSAPPANPDPDPDADADADADADHTYRPSRYGG